MLLTSLSLRNRYDFYGNCEGGERIEASPCHYMLLWLVIQRLTYWLVPAKRNMILFRNCKHEVRNVEMIGSNLLLSFFPVISILWLEQLG